MTQTRQPRNIVLFGECGVGKSSIINMIAGKLVAKISNDVLGCTEANVPHTVHLDRGDVHLWDTIGLGEGTFGKIPASDAKKSLELFLHQQLATPEGIDLLLYCIRGASHAKSLPLKNDHRKTYRFVVEDVCKKRVPVAMVITNLEAYDQGGDMDQWWGDNKKTILDFGFQLCGHACVTVLSPDDVGEHDDVSRIDVSRQRLRDLLSHNFLPVSVPATIVLAKRQFHQPRNVLLLGDPDDKGDFINMMKSASDTATPAFKVENAPSFTCLPVALASDTHFNLWNTTEFDDADITAQMTDRNLKLLIQGIRQTAGIDLLLFCFRAGRPKIRHTRTYNLFYTAICRKKVPVVIAVLGPEEAWWGTNEQGLKERGLRFERHVCIPCHPSEFPGGVISSATRLQLIDLIREDYTSGTWRIGNEAPWVTVPYVRAVVVLGELSWPTTTVAICDPTRKETFVEIAPGVQSSVRCAVGVINQREYRFLQVDPKSLSSSSPQIHPRVLEPGWKSTGLIMFYMDANATSDTWRSLEKFYSGYRGDITPFIVVVHGLAERRLAEDVWKTAPSTIRKQIGAYVTYHPGPSASSDDQTAAQKILEGMIQELCLVCMEEKVGILQEIVSSWRRYRSQRSRES